MDVLLSSGFLAFARHIGFLESVEAHNIQIDRLIGTSSGAVIGALWAAGYRGERLRKVISEKMPLKYVKWPALRGIFHLKPMISYLRTLLPNDVADLELPFHAGVTVGGLKGKYMLLNDAGDLPEVVAASCAIPFLFEPVHIMNVPCYDGGFTDRIGINEWNTLYPNHRALIHHVERSRGNEPPLIENIRHRTIVVKSARSRATLWNLGAFESQILESRTQTDNMIKSNIEKLSV